MPKHSDSLWGDERTPAEAASEGYREGEQNVGNPIADLVKAIADLPEKTAQEITGEDPRTSQEKAYDEGYEQAQKDNSWF
jgi:hypothetical protein